MKELEFCPRCGGWEVEVDDYTIEATEVIFHLFCNECMDSEQGWDVHLTVHKLVKVGF